MRKVVITGLGTINALGNNVKDCWNNASQGKGGVDYITKFDASEYRSRMAAEVKNFDPSPVIAKKDLKKLGTFIQYALYSAKEALDDANLEITESNASQIGCVVGVGIGDLDNIYNNSALILEGKQNRISPFFIPATLSNMAAGQISIFFGAQGYNTSVVSACSSSNHSIGDAAGIIERGEAEVMITGGSEATICSLGVGGFSAMKALSCRNDDPKTASRPYDVNRDGFVMGEGSGIFILESEEHAKKRGAKIYAEVIGYGVSADAHHMTAPSQEGPSRAMRLALQKAEILPEQVDYINAHGTSTPVGDINEILAVKNVFGEHAKKLSISATKSMHGHALGGAGGIEGVITIKAMQDGIIPPTINIEELDAACDLDVTPNKAKEKKISIAMSNSFGFGGTNATLIFKTSS
jgi:3-oxoacyl-[acyl-carrier-protein] synthase II